MLYIVYLYEHFSLLMEMYFIQFDKVKITADFGIIFSHNFIVHS
jgi:hypothetical protein